MGAQFRSWLIEFILEKFGLRVPTAKSEEPSPESQQSGVWPPPIIPSSKRPIVAPSNWSAIRGYLNSGSDVLTPQQDA